MLITKDVVDLHLKLKVSEETHHLTEKASLV